jgi:hypothetical protein
MSGTRDHPARNPVAGRLFALLMPVAWHLAGLEGDPIILLDLLIARCLPQRPG